MLRRRRGTGLRRFSLGGAIVGDWALERFPGGTVTIWPDGCRDAVWSEIPGSPPSWNLTGLDREPRGFSVPWGSRMRGFRLAPGVAIPEGLEAMLDPERPESAAALLLEACSLSDDVEEFFAACREAPASPNGLARRLGVGLRTLERAVAARTGETPLFWSRLTRLRRAFALARAGVSLADAAFEAGFADQAHFTRESRSFYAATPARLLRDGAAMDAILVPGL